MKLFFCDICNESIPLQDIKENKSSTIKGKIFCRKCNPLNELEGSDSGSDGSSGSNALLGLVAVLLILIVAGLGFVIYEIKFSAGNGAGAAEGSSLAAPDNRLAELGRAVDRLQVDVGELNALRELTTRVGSMKEQLDAQAAGRAALVKDIGELQGGLLAVGSLREKFDGILLQQEEASQQLERLTSSLARVQTELDALADRPPVIVASSGDTTDPASSDAGGGALDEELLATVEKLSANDPMARWEAVDQIRRRRDKALVSHVIPLLDDRDTFVRAQAIYTLGELKAMSAVPRLIKLLRDDEIMIREEALTSLVVITGQNMKFDVTGSRSVRDKGIRKWEDWLAKNKDKF